MKVEPVITFRNLAPIEWVEEDVQERVARLESACDEITACRVLVEVPHRRHHHGNRFHIRIDLSVPGHEIAVSLAPDLHAQQRELKARSAEKRVEIEAARKDGRLVIRQAFDRARRRLRDYAQRRRLAVKAHTRRGSRPRVRRSVM